MKRLMDTHSMGVFLKPGEVIVTRGPVLVSTILGSCVAVTMHSPNQSLGAICHAAYPASKGREPSLHAVETAIHHIYRRMIEDGGGADMVVKLFGGANVLACAEMGDSRKTIGEQNVLQALECLSELGLVVAKRDVGGSRGRKLLFSIKTGDVFLRRLKSNAHINCIGE